MKAIEIPQRRRLLTEEEVARLFGIPPGFRLNKAEVSERSGKKLLEVIWHGPAEVIEQSVDLLLEPKEVPGVDA